MPSNPLDMEIRVSATLWVHGDLSAFVWGQQQSNQVQARLTAMIGRQRNIRPKRWLIWTKEIGLKTPDYFPEWGLTEVLIPEVRVDAASGDPWTHAEVVQMFHDDEFFSWYEGQVLAFLGSPQIESWETELASHNGYSHWDQNGVRLERPIPQGVWMSGETRVEAALDDVGVPPA